MTKVQLSFILSNGKLFKKSPNTFCAGQERKEKTLSSETHLNAFIAVTKKAVLFVVTVLAFIAGALIPRFFFVVSGNGVIDGLVFGLVCAFVAYKGAYIALARRP